MTGKNMSDNISGMDTQHRKLGEQVKALCEALKNGSTLNDLTGKLDDLLVFTDTHFADEEDLMRLYGYDGLDSHTQTHKRLFDTLASLRGDLVADFSEKEKKKLVLFFEGDFQRHITEDMQAWERGEIAKNFAYQRLRERDPESEHRHMV